MALVTGSPVGSITTQEEIYLVGAPYIYFQDYTADPLNNPDADGFYWGLSGTTLYPVLEIGCPRDVSFSENLTINDVLCDTVGVKSTVQQRNYMEFTFTAQNFFPFSILRYLVKGGAVTVSGGLTEKFGIGQVNNQLYFHIYAPYVYNEDVGDYIWLYINKAQFVDAFTVNMSFGTPWQITGVRLRGFADTTKPSTQYFGMWGRADLSAVP